MADELLIVGAVWRSAALGDAEGPILVVEKGRVTVRTDKLGVTEHDEAAFRRLFTFVHGSRS